MKHRWFLPVGLSLLLVLLMAAPAAASATPLRPMKGGCATTFTLGFDPSVGVPLVHILGTCQFTHLGASKYEAWQWLYPDGTLVNQGTYTAANGDRLFAFCAGVGLPTGPTTTEFQYSEWYTGGTGRFAHVVTPPLTGPPSLTGAGGADLAAGAGWFMSVGSIGY